MNILIVEDEKSYARYYESILKRYGYNLIAYGNEGRSYVRTYQEAVAVIDSEHIDLALIDLDLESKLLGGIDVAKYLISKGTTPFVFLSKHVLNNGNPYFQKAQSLLPAGYLYKMELSEIQLIHAVQCALDKTIKRDYYLLPGTDYRETPEGIVFRDAINKSHMPLIRVEDIFFIQASGKSCRIYFTNNAEGKFMLVDVSGKRIENIYGPPLFHLTRKIIGNMMWFTSLKEVDSRHWLVVLDSPFSSMLFKVSYAKALEIQRRFK